MSVELLFSSFLLIALVYYTHVSEWVYSRGCGTYALFPVPPGGFNFTYGWMPGRISQD
jgi:hypothetical protein